MGIQEELDLKGIRHLGGPADAGLKVELTPGLRLDQDPDVSATPPPPPIKLAVVCVWGVGEGRSECARPIAIVRHLHHLNFAPFTL